MFTEELAGLRRHQPHMQVVPVHGQALAEPARGRPVIGALDFDAAVEMYGAFAEAVVPKRLERQWAKRRPLFGKHDGDLALRRPVNARVGPARIPPVQIRLRGLDRLKAQTFQRRLLRVAHARFDFAFGESRQLRLMRMLRIKSSGSPTHFTR
jgi:hypothetical protein